MERSTPEDKGKKERKIEEQRKLHKESIGRT